MMNSNSQEKPEQAATNAISGLVHDRSQSVAAKDGAMPQSNSILPSSVPYSGDLDESNWNGSFAPISLARLLSQPVRTVPWIIEGYVAQGRLTLLAGPPKLGKTTLTYDAVARVAKGESFLGRNVCQSKVLVLGLEEHESDMVERLRQKGGLGDLVMVQCAPLAFDDGTLNKLGQCIKEKGIGMVLIDTLPAWWDLKDENDAAEVLRKSKPLLRCVRLTKAGWLAIAHTRKAGGRDGQEVRGSSALLGQVDIAISMKGEFSGQRRTLQAVGRYKETPRELIIEYRDDSYLAIGGPIAVSIEGKAEKLYAALTEEEGRTVDELVLELGMSKQDISRAVQKLGTRIVKEGDGVKGDPHKYRRNAIHPDPEPWEVEMMEESDNWATFDLSTIYDQVLPANMN